jgi:hypothetical protein
MGSLNVLVNDDARLATGSHDPTHLAP